MKHILSLLLISLFILSGCNTKADQADATCSCVAEKETLELTMNIPLKIKPEFVAAYKTAFEKCQAGTLKEEACLDYALYQSYTDSTEFHLFERWTDKPGHRAHMQTDHFNVYKEETKGFYDKPKTQTIEVYVCPCVN
ncbi:putative quinol monooxygenase [Parabacteroides sp. PF5-6]|uniref:putative quinol monooxygenase n=1 Tax=Parabacteroides sp. PF5-6 TaxID=1742403 RepID=UPI00240640F8|nr:putative quinol monooxygenase [Parabacteroides sp. PF5-6]MDF9829128.1 quinol monooxygenase YgiN [Parabacteroides sp. PF5-6]